MFRLLTLVPFLLLSYLHSAPFTLQDCFQLSLEENPKNFSSCMRVKEAQEESLIEKAACYPEVKASAHGFKWQTHNFLELTTFPPGVPPDILPSVIGPTEDYGYLVSAKYTLYDFGEARERYLAARSKKGAAEYDRIRLQEEILLNVALTFYQLASYDELKRVAKNNLERTEHHLKLVQEKRDVGTAPLSDLLRAQVDVAEAKLNLVRMNSQVEIARARLREAIGLDSDTELLIHAERSDKERPEEKDLLLARRTAYAARPEIKSICYQISGRSHQLKAVQSTNWPKVTALLPGLSCRPNSIRQVPSHHPSPYPVRCPTQSWPTARRRVERQHAGHALLLVSTGEVYDGQPGDGARATGGERSSGGSNFGAGLLDG